MTTPNPQITVELLRRLDDGTLTSWLLNNDGTEKVSDAIARDRLEAIRALLAGVRDVRVTNQAGSVISTVNSTSVALLASAEFVGAWEDVHDYSAISVLINTDQPSAPNGAVLEFSIDGATVDRSIPTSIPAGGGVFSFFPQAEFMRLRYKNGATAQTVMRAETILEYTAPGLVQQPLGAPLTDANVAAVVRAGIAGRRAVGAYVPLAATDTGSLRVALDSLATLGTEATLASVLAAVDTLEALSTGIRAEQFGIDDQEAVAVGTLGALGATLELDLPPGMASVNVQLSGTFSAGTVVSFEGLTGDGVWVPTNGRINPMTAEQNSVNTVTGSMAFGPGPTHHRISAASFDRFRVRVSSYTAADSITATLRASSAPGGTFLLAGIPSGQNFIGYVADFESRAVESGRYRWAGGKTTTSLTTPNASMTVTNPSTSGQDIVITRFMVEVDAAADVVYLDDAASTGELKALENPNQRLEVPNLAEVRVGAGVLTGGTLHSPVRKATPDSPIAVGPFEWKIPPGSSWSVRFLGPGATNVVHFNVGLFAIDAGGRLQ